VRRFLLMCALVMAAAAFGAAGTYNFLHQPEAAKPDPASVVLRIREVARLETLDVAVHKKIAFTPDPKPQGSVLGEIWNWARYSLHPPRGRAIVFANVHLALDLEKLGQQSLRITGKNVWMVLPPIESHVELKADETEIIDSNLDSAQTAELLGLASRAIEQDVMGDKALHERAKRSAERSIRGLLMSLGFADVHFVESLPTASGA
jgi:hypothetical protein